MPNPTISEMVMTPTSPHVGFVELAQQYCEEHGLGDAFRKDVRIHFLKALGKSYWEPVRGHMVKSSWPPAKACKAAGLAPSTHTRWDEKNPTFETICLLFARCDLNMNEVHFPDGPNAIKAAHFKTIEHIRSKYLKEAPSRFDDEAFECLCQVFVNPAFHNVLRMIEIAEDEGNPFSDNVKAALDSLNKAAEEIASTLQKKFPTGRIATGAAVQQTIDEWLISWVLLYNALPSAQTGGLT